MIIPELIRAELKEIGDMLIEKNNAYGNSVFEPAGIFSKLNPVEGLKIRIDDKLKRIKNGDITEDSEMDLIGYLVLKRIAGKL